MQTAITLFAFLFFLSRPAAAQNTTSPGSDRSRITIMVIPYTSGSENIFQKMDSMPGYKEAISGINSALINMGYKNTLDFRTLRENIDNRRGITANDVKSDRMKIYIENAPVDVLVKTEIIWIDPPGNPRNRQVRILLQALDRYTSLVYADNASLQSAQREFPGLAVAVDHALKWEGNAEFSRFLDQLDASFDKVVKEGRSVNIKFETATEGSLKLSDQIGDERLADKIEECIRQNALGGQYRTLGESDNYMDFTVQIPIKDDNGASVTPSLYLRKRLDTYFRQVGLSVNYLVIGNWINFILVKKTSS